MKRSFISLFVVAILLVGCATSRPSSRPREESTVIRIECRDNRMSKLNVSQLLRSTQARDITMTGDGQYAHISAVYIHTDGFKYKMEKIISDLVRMTDVLHVELDTNKSMIRHAF